MFKLYEWGQEGTAVIAMRKRKIIYISGEGHSGTTLLDVILGSQESAFSSGELNFFAQKGIKNKEYCACGSPVPECDIWSEVIEEWDKKRTLDLDDYIAIQKKLTSKKNIVLSHFLLKNPSGEISDFLKDTSLIYEIIFRVTGSKIIVDSSKAPGRLLILKKLDFELEVIHLVRRYGDVLNSYKQKAKKDLKKGVEHDIKPSSTSYVFFSWFSKNMLTSILSKNMPYRKIKYENLVINPVKELSGLAKNDNKFAIKLKQRGPFYKKHLVAGNQMRMKDYIFIADKPMHTSYHRLNRRNRMLAKFIDLFY